MKVQISLGSNSFSLMVHSFLTYLVRKQCQSDIGFVVKSGVESPIMLISIMKT